MIDRANFRRLNPNYSMPQIKKENKNSLPPSGGYSRSTVSVPLPVPSAVPMSGGVPWITPTLMNAESNKLKPEEEELSDEELMLASPVLYGFSLSDKLWCKHWHLQAQTPVTLTYWTIRSGIQRRERI